jgi:predicted DCC family thiol-disulfide oxidoreductase YuxK
MTHAPEGWVLYDGSCGFCSRWVRFWAPTLEKRGFAIAPLQADWVRDRAPVFADRLLDDLRLLTREGSLVEGADVYRFVMKRIWWAYPAYLLSVAPGFSTIFDRAYRTFADNRYRVSRSCGLEGRS